MKTITYQNEGKERLDKFLANELKKLSRSQIQKMIEGGEFLVNGQTVASHHWLKKGDIIIAKKATVEVKKPVIEKPVKTKIDKTLLPVIIKQTADYLVITKPAGLLVHPTSQSTELTLIDWLVKKFPAIKKVGENPERPGLVHRLDKGVSGLLVIAKTKPMYAHLKQQFKARQTKKEYLGLVYGKISADEGIIDFPLKRSRRSGKIVAQAKGAEGRESLTEYLVIKKLTNYTYLKLYLKTGRSHQLRAHLSAIDHPLIGDELYGHERYKDSFNLKRIFLHSHLLGFYDLKNKWQEFTSPLPTNLDTILKKLV
ncbi:MAG: RluA family pseudouridine synthase [Patescibacteria group bacterium]|jgi:23S rRNA pseudouridine1911/1915/1917 synthase